MVIFACLTSSHIRANIGAIVVFSQSGGALHVDLFLVCVWCGRLSRCERWVFSLPLCSLDCEQFYSLRTYRTSVFPFTFSLSSWKFNRAAYSSSSSNSNIEENKSKSSDSPRHKIDTKPKQRVHHIIEWRCSWIETMYSFLFYPYRTESSIGQCVFFFVRTSVFAESNHQRKSSVQI